MTEFKMDEDGRLDDASFDALIAGLQMIKKKPKKTPKDPETKKLKVDNA